MLQPSKPWARARRGAVCDALTWRLVIAAVLFLGVVLGLLWGWSLYTTASVAVVKDQIIACRDVGTFGWCTIHTEDLLEKSKREYCAVAAAVCQSDTVLTTLVAAGKLARKQLTWVLPGPVVEAWSLITSLPGLGMMLSVASLCFKAMGVVVPWNVLWSVVPHAAWAVAALCGRGRGHGHGWASHPRPRPRTQRPDSASGPCGAPGDCHAGDPDKDEDVDEDEEDDNAKPRTGVWRQTPANTQLGRWLRPLCPDTV
jgi:hypothetical protein